MYHLHLISVRTIHRHGPSKKRARQFPPHGHQCIAWQKACHSNSWAPPRQKKYINKRLSPAARAVQAAAMMPADFYGRLRTTPEQVPITAAPCGATFSVDHESMLPNFTDSRSVSFSPFKHFRSARVQAKPHTVMSTFWTCGSAE